MPEVSEHTPGTPSWVDLGTPDIEASASFYGGLFGWDVPESENAEQTGGYRQAMLRGKPVAGMMPLMQEGQPPAWSSYVSVEDADATAAKVTEAGGQVMAEPMDVMDLGRMAVFADPTGAVFGIWQAGSFAGAGIVGDPGAVVWNELNTPDPDRAKQFYTDVFGWETRPFGGEGGPPYLTAHVGGEETGVAGIMDTRAFDQEVPPHWMVYFAVEDVDNVAGRVSELGGTVAQEPTDIPEVGRMAVFNDPAGVHFAVLKPNPQQ
jgi:predicted enzyme related to lactoylglutathione lyase